MADAITPLRADARRLHAEMKWLIQDIAYAAMKNLDKWGPGSDGRAVKATTETLLRSLESSRGIAITAQNQQEIAQQLVRLQASDFFREHIYNISARKKAGYSTLGTWLDHYIERLLSLSNVLVKEEFRAEFERRIQKSIDEENELREVVASLVADQKTGPIKFHIVNGVLQLANPENNIDTSDVETAEAARAALLAIGASLISDMDSSNCDHRFTQGISKLNQDLASSENIILIGLNASAQQAVAERKFDELNDFISTKLNVYLSGIQMYVSQFETWRIFSYNATAANLASTDADVAKNAGAALLGELRAVKDVVDPEVENELSGLLEAAEKTDLDPKISYSILTTITNFVAVVYRSTAPTIAELLVAARQGAAEGIKKGSEKVATVVTLATFGAIAAVVVPLMLPNAAKAVGADWLPKAVSALQDAIKAAGS